MQWSVTKWITHFATVILLLSIIYNVGGFKIKNQDTIYNRMICENEKLQIDCKESGKVLNIQRAYYGRYSITPCNKNHIQYTMGCTANNTLDVLKKLCQSRASCDIHATNSIFGNPCRNSTNVLELIYNCYDEIKNETKVANESEHSSTKYTKTNFMTSSIESTLRTSTVENTHLDIEDTNKDFSTYRTTGHQTSNSIEEIFNYIETSSTEKNIVTHVETNDVTKDVTKLSTKASITAKIQCLFSENQNITEHFNFGNHAVYVDQMIHIPCSVEAKGLSGTKLFICKPDGRFHYVNSTCVKINSLWLESFGNKIHNKANSMKLMEIMNHDLKSNRSDELLQAKKSIGAVVDLFQNASANLKDNTDHSKNVLVETAGTIIDKSLNWKKLSQKDRSKSATKLIDVVENIIFQKIYNNPDTEAVYDDQTRAFSIRTKNILAEVSSNDELKNEINFPSNENFESDEFAKVTIENPEKSQKFMFAIYKNVNELFSSENDLIDESETSPKAAAAANKKIIVNSNIISFKMNHKRDIDYLKKVPIELTFKHLTSDDDYTQNEIKPICSYWKFDKKTYDRGHWSPDGCHVKQSNRTHTVCQCNHLTHFAILMDIYGVHEDLPENHEITLTIITIICSFISCVSIILTLLAFRFVKIIKKSREQSTTKDLTTITTHLCACLLISLVLFLTGIAAQKLKLKVFCSSIALLTHYFFLCSFFWMLLEGVQLYFMLVRIFILNKSPVKRFCFIAYGLPILIVLGSKLTDIYMLDSLGYGTSNHCWISNYRYFNLTFIIPVTLILFANFFLLIIVIYGMRNTMSTRQTKLNQKQDDFFKSLFGFWCIIITLLGLPWIIGYLMIDTKSTLVFSYLFTIVNSSQGTIVFIFHCIVSKSVREEILKLLRKRKKHLLTKESQNTTSLFCFPSSKSRSLQRGPSDSSSFKSPRKFFDSVRLIDRKSSNCSSSQTNTISAQNTKNINNNKKGYGHNQNSSFLNNFYQLICFCFISSEDITPPEYKYNKNVKTSQSFSNNSRTFNDTTQSPLRNYSSTLSAQKSMSKTFNDEASVNLLPSEPCYNCQNIICSNGLNQSINKQILNK